MILPACSTTTEDAPGCSNGARDEGEEGTDCGGVCPTKCSGASCTTGAECASGKCENGVCGARDGKPCGVGVAAQCNQGDACELDKDCTTGFCDAGKCGVASSESHSDGKKNGGETGVDCGGTVKTDKPCPDGQGCADNTDCVGTCTNLICGPIGPADGKKNLDETDVDCGGATAPKCANAKACLANADCADDYCPDATKKCTAPTYEDGVQNGTETDVDCGGSGTGMKKCAETKSCAVDADCNAACKYDKKCIDTPSCKPHFGGDTCGSGGPGSIPLTAAAHESCCRSLPTGYSDTNQPGKAVYLDKYEITAGRMRAFIDSVSAQNAGVPNIKGYMATHRPASRWNAGWENVLPTAMTGTTATFSTSNPTVDLLYPGQDRYLANAPTQNTWSVASGNWTIYPDVVRSLGGLPLFPEYVTAPNVGWPTDDYAVTHGFNCSNTPESFGFSTYWFDQATMAAVGSGAQGKFFSKDELDQKSLNCTPAGLFAAFCAWDGGQLATAEVIDAVTGNGTAFTTLATMPCGKTDPNNPLDPGTLITQSDAGSGGCYKVYFYPNDMGNRFDGSARIAPPGRVPADVVAANGQEWRDLKGNLVETVLLSSGLFGSRGYGMGWGTATHHRNQQTTPRHKTATFGARCMRFK